MKKTIIIIMIILSIIMTTLLLIIFNELFTKTTAFLIIISLIVFDIGLFLTKPYIELLGYIIALFTVLFVREKTEIGISDGTYLIEWIKIMFKNKIVFMNIIGNLVLYVPAYLILEGHINNKGILLIIIIVMIITGECLQYLLSIGVLDVSDIILNTIGVLLSSGLYGVLKWIKKIKRKKIKNIKNLAVKNN